MSGPAYRIHTPRLVLRCWQPQDAPLLAEAIAASLDHLRPWMPWAHHEPEELDAKVQRLRRFRGQFDLDQDYIYAIFSPDERKVIGGTGLHPRVGPGACEIGYWISARHVGQGYATEAAAALTRVGFEVNALERLEIRCAPANVPSAAVPRRLGYTHEATLRGRVRDERDQPVDAMIWTLFSTEYRDSPAAAAQAEAFDAGGQRVL